MPISAVSLRNIKVTDKTQRIFDGGGLYLEVTPKGKTWWRLKYRFNDKEKRISLGVFPDVSLSMARDRRDEARRLVADKIDPSEHRKIMKRADIERTANSFEMVAREWFVKYSTNWVSSHSDKIIQRFERDIFPWIGGIPISEVTPSILLTVIRRIEGRGALETAHRA
jgi:hypothetical protein